MKSEHRHELKTNELGRLAAKALPVFEDHGNKILAALVAVALVLAGAVYWTRTSTASAEAGWAELTAARTAEDFGNVADQYPGSKVGTWARLQQALGHYQNGLQLAFSDRDSALDELKQAREGFEKVVNRDDTIPEAREEALFGLARTLETLSDGNLDDAIAAYERLLREFPNTIYKEKAENRITELRTDEARQLYAWFHKQHPEPPDRPAPRDGMPAGGLNLDDLLPSGHPPFDLKGEPSGKAADETDATSGPALPAADDKSASEEKTAPDDTGSEGKGTPAPDGPDAPEAKQPEPADPSSPKNE